MNAKNASYVMFGMLLLSVILFKLAPAALAGFLVSTLVLKLAGKIASHINVKFSKIIAVAVIAILVVSLFSLAGLGILHVFQGKEGLNALALQLVQVLQNLRQSLPENIASYIPESALGLKELSIEFLQEHSAQVGAVGVESLKGFAHVLLGMVVGGLIAVHEFQDDQEGKPLVAALRARARTLAVAFEKVVFAQIKISAINTSLTALYLLVVLPLFGIHLPFAKTLVLITFLVGLIPVLGNIVSNTAIVLISLGVGFGVAVSSLVFLVVIHKLEYFINAKIVGHEVDAHAWELISAMLILEAVLGVVGLILAPILYAYVKAEFKAEGLV